MSLADTARLYWKRLRRALAPAQGRVDGFAAWRIFNAPSERAQNLVRELADNATGTVPFTVILPAQISTPEAVSGTITSLLSQSYPNFEILIVAAKQDLEDGLSAVIEEWISHDPRVRLITQQEAALSAAINLGANAANGDFILLLDGAGVLHRDALLVFAEHIARNPLDDIIYCDDATLEAGASEPIDPRFKPDWSPELLLSYRYICSVQVLRASLFQDIGGCRPELAGAHIHDLLLRAGERAKGIGHIPQLLFYRFSRSTEAGTPQEARAAGIRVVEEAFGRRGVECSVDRAEWAGERNVYVPRMPDEGPSVALLISTKNNWKILDRLIQSLAATTYRNYEVYIVDNMSDDAETKAYLESLRHTVLRIANPGTAFNYAHINSRAAEQVDAEYVLFLNDDMSVINTAWLSQMVGWARLPGVGAVGARLLFPDGRVQHGGVVMGLRKGLTAFRGLERRDPGYLGLARTTRNCSAVTAAAMLTPRALFLELGGFDEAAFAVSYNDVDYCLRLGDAGYRVVYCGEAELYHHQGYTRGSGTTSPFERAELEKRHSKRRDAYYNPNLSLDGHGFTIKPTVVPPLHPARPLRVLIAATDSERNAGVAKHLIARLGDANLFEVQLANSTRANDFQDVDVVCAVGADCFAAIEKSHEQRVPSVWLIADDDTSDNASGAHATCFRYPYRVLFLSQRTRRHFVHLDKMDNFDLLPAASHGGLGAIIESAAFSAIPDQASKI